MKTRHISVIAGGLIAIFNLSDVAAELSAEQMAKVDKKMEILTSVYHNMPDAVKQKLSGSARNFFEIPASWPEIKNSLAQPQGDQHGLVQDKKKIPFDRVSDPNASEDGLSQFSGFTQSETDSAWCRRNIAVGFNDTGSLVDTMLNGISPSLSFSIVGWAQSSDRGESFEDRGALLPDPLPSGVIFRDLGGDPVIECADDKTFYFGSLASDVLEDERVLSGISVSRSTDGGLSWGSAIVAARKDANDHFLDKPWMAVDPADPNRIYVTYTDFEFSESSQVCPGEERTAIEIVTSADGGETWTEPQVISEVCGQDFVQGSQVIVGPGGEVYVAWEAFPGGIDGFFELNEPRTMLIRKSTDGGASFEPSNTITEVTPVGDGFLLKGSFRSLFEVPSLGVDRSSGPMRGTVYMTWHDGRNATVPDGLSPSLTYGFADILVTRSEDGGASWTSPALVNDNEEPPGTDQYQPGIAVDQQTGRVAVCFYDRRKDPNNFLIDRFCALSHNGGDAWTNKRLTERAFAPVPFQDILTNPVYMGDYDTVASDFIQSTEHTGYSFFGAWGDNSLGNPDVRGRRF